jgi:hypothetical protein
MLDRLSIFLKYIEFIKKLVCIYWYHVLVQIIGGISKEINAEHDI